MVISGVSISNYGLKLIRISGEHDQPARKKTLREPGFDAKDLVFKDKVIEVRLLGKYADQQTLAANIEAFKTQLNSGVIDFTFPDHNFSIGGICESGVKVKVYGNIAHCEFKITVKNG